MEVVSVEVESYRDVEVFGKMAPYLVVNREYCSAVGVGKNDLFWKMNLLLPLGNKYTNVNNPTR